MINANRYFFGSLLLGVTLAASCADVSVRKVPTPTQYTEWTDSMQREADGMEGFRFYLPRPFLNVFESFPVSTEVYIANGFVSPDGKYVNIERIRSTSAPARMFVGSDKNDYPKIPARFIHSPSDELIKAQSLSAKEAKELAQAQGKADAERVKTGVDGTPRGETSNSSQSSTSGRTGLNERDVNNDNGAFAYQPMRGNFDVAYLPDFEEQYVIDSHAGLGNAQFALNLGQGWSLQGFNSLTDNSALNDRIFDVIDTSIELAKAAAAGVLGGPPAALAPGAIELAKPQSGQALPETHPQAIPHDPVSLKIVVVHYAAKGLYPVIKPRELQERQTKAVNEYLFIDLFHWFPGSVPASAFDANAIERAQSATANAAGSFTVPRYPYQYVSFNTFRYVTIELIRADQPPSLNLINATGTTGERGDAQFYDMAKWFERQFGAGNGTQNAPETFRMDAKHLAPPWPSTFGATLQGVLQSAIEADADLKGLTIEEVEVFPKAEGRIELNIKFSGSASKEAKLQKALEGKADDALSKDNRFTLSGFSRGTVTKERTDSELQWLESNKAKLIATINRNIAADATIRAYNVASLTFAVNAKQVDCTAKLNNPAVGLAATLQATIRSTLQTEFDSGAQSPPLGLQANTIVVIP